MKTGLRMMSELPNHHGQWPGATLEGLGEFLTTGELAKALKVTPSTLCRWRSSGVGPRVHWLGKHTPRYRRSDVMSWLETVAA